MMQLYKRIKDDHNPLSGNMRRNFSRYSYKPVDMTGIERNKRVVEHLLKSDDVNDYYYIKKMAKGDFDND